MIIAVHTKSLLNDGGEGAGYFAKKMVLLLARHYPQHRFYLLSEQLVATVPDFPENVTSLVLRLPTRSLLSWKYWSDPKLSSALRKIKAEVLVSLDGAFSLRTKVPQCLLVPDLKLLYQPKSSGRHRYPFYKRYASEYLKKARSVLVLSEAVKNDLLQASQTDPQKITVLSPSAREGVHPVPFEQQAAVKERYTQGKEFFMAVHPAGVADLIHLLKAFSVFKKRQRSEMKLVLAKCVFTEFPEFLQLLNTYKHREDVLLLDTLKEEEWALLFASAYALVALYAWKDWGMSLLDGMKCHIPVLSSGGTSERELGDDAALYFNTEDPVDIADKLMLIYKDEDLRKSLIEKGRTLQAGYNWQDTAHSLWEVIQKAVGESKTRLT